jgi:cytochrome c oxidase assembly factor 4
VPVLVRLLGNVHFFRRALPWVSHGPNCDADKSSPRLGVPDPDPNHEALRVFRRSITFSRLANQRLNLALVEVPGSFLTFLPLASIVLRGSAAPTTQLPPQTMSSAGEKKKETTTTTPTPGADDDVDDWQQAIQKGGCAEENARVQDCYEFTKDWRRCRFEVLPEKPKTGGLILQLDRFKKCWAVIDAARRAQTGQKV